MKAPLRVRIDAGWKKYTGEELDDFLIQSNAIEGVYGKKALKDARKAWFKITKFSHVLPEHLLRAHGLLLRRIEPSIAGQWRTCDVWIGGEKKTFISAALLEDRVLDLLKMIFSTLGTQIDEERRSDIAKNAHIIFEDIHPFQDGNGRIGRMLYNWHRLRLGLPLHVIREGEEQTEYYKWFKKIK